MLSLFSVVSGNSGCRTFYGGSRSILSTPGGVRVSFRVASVKTSFNREIGQDSEKICCGAVFGLFCKKMNMDCAYS